MIRPTCWMRRYLRIVRSTPTALLIGFSITSCSGGGGTGGPPPPEPDFALTVSGAVSVVQGATTSPITVGVTALNGFTGSVSIAIAALPSGATTAPSFPLSVSAGAKQQFTITVPATTPTGDTAVALTGTSGSTSHSATITLTTGAVQTSQSAGILYLQSTVNGHTARIGLNTAWGGSIVEVSLDGTNFVNEHDTGREVQPALYDGAGMYTSFNCGPCIGTWSWNPVLGGDRYDHGSPVLSSHLGAALLDITAQPLEWNPDDKGGGPNTPITSDTTVEQIVSLVPGYPLAFKIHLIVTHTGSDQHYNAGQELPAVYVNSPFSILSYYGGTNPWTNAPTTSMSSVPALPADTGDLYSSEEWAAYSDVSGQGLTVFVPGQYPFLTAFSAPGGGGSGPMGDTTYYFRPYTTFSFSPSTTLEEDVYLIPGNINTARSMVYDLHQSLSATNTFTPIGTVDAPSANATISGTNVPFAGWALAPVSVTQVQLIIDGAGAIATGLNVNRPDVVAAYPNFAPLQCGWNVTFDSTKLTNGTHKISANITDASGNVAILPPVGVTVSN